MRALRRASHITGVLLSTDGTPTPGVTVHARTRSGSSSFYVASATTGDNGFFDIGGLSSDTYYLEVSGNSNIVVGEYFEDKTSLSNATPIVVGVDSTVGPLSLQVALAGSISGVVVDHEGNPIQSALVVAHDAATGSWVRSAYTDMDGRFSVLQLPEGSYVLYTSAANGPHLAEWYDDVQLQSEAAPIDLGAGSDVSGLDVRLAPSASISGSVTNDSGEAIPYTPVRLYTVEDPAATLATTYTDADGLYYFGGLSANSYLVRFVGNATYSAEWFDDAASAETATPIDVVVGENAVDVSAVLTDSFIAGTVTDGAGTPIAGVTLALYNSTGSSQRSATSDVAGRLSSVLQLCRQVSTRSMRSIPPGASGLDGMAAPGFGHTTRPSPSIKRRR